MSSLPDNDCVNPARAVTFWVPGSPAPGGSKRFLGKGKRTMRAIIVDAGGARNKAWRAHVAHFAAQAFSAPFIGKALHLDCKFILHRPAYHYHTGKRRGVLRANAPEWHICAPDITKLLRSTEDAMKGIAWDDDSHVAKQSAVKVYGEQTGCLITISLL